MDAAFGLDGQTLRWGIVAASPTAVCLHCGRDTRLHAGACWNEPVGRFLDGARAF